MIFRHEIPHARPDEAIGLLGGSFDPPHAGHLHITRAALVRFGLDRVWWLASPGNPLKAHGPAAMEARLAAARTLIAGDPRIIVTDIEARFGTRHTAATLGRLVRLYPRARFVWLMGADNLAQFHRWDRWPQIMATMPVGVIARPDARLAAPLSRAARRFRRARLREADAPLLARKTPPAWCLINVPLSDASSSAIRDEGDWQAADMAPR